MTRALSLCLFFLLALPAAALPPPHTIAQLRALETPRRLDFVRELAPGPGYRAYLVGFEQDGLSQYALVAEPTLPVPPRGFPVLVANHGYHPDPARYGFTAEGRDARPGDYYRSVPELYAAHGFLVVMPDYRGHNASAGIEYTKSDLAGAYYAADALAVIAGVGSLRNADARNLFLWGHSLGGEVTLRVLLAGAAVRGAALWSTVGGGPAEEGSQESAPEQFIAGLAAPLIIHHSAADATTPFAASQRLVDGLHELRKPYEMHRYAGDQHFFEEPERSLAAGRDAAFFRGLITGDP